SYCSELYSVSLHDALPIFYFNGIGLDARIEEFLAFSMPNFSLITGIGGAVTGGLLSISCVGRTHAQQSNCGSSIGLRYVWFKRFIRRWLTAGRAGWIKRSRRQFRISSLCELGQLFS